MAFTIEGVIAETIKQEIKTFLRESLKLTLSEEKTHITNARTEEAFFLGTTFTIGNGGEAKIAQQTSPTGKTFHRRSTGWETVLKAPLPRLIKRLGDRGFCTKEGKPRSKTGWTNLDADQIINLYSAVNRGIQNYYRFADNWSQLNRVQYILELSLTKTLAHKFKITKTKVYKRFGKELAVVIKGKDGKPDRKVSFYRNRDWKKKRDAFQSGKHSDIDLVSKRRECERAQNSVSRVASVAKQQGKLSCTMSATFGNSRTNGKPQDSIVYCE
jgi:hypothetical protein